MTVVRPGAILGDRAETRSSERIFGALLRTLGPILPKRYRGNPAEDLARVLLAAAVEGTSGAHVVNAGHIA